MTSNEKIAVDPDLWLAQHGDALYLYARTRVAHQEEAEDLVQESFLAALRNWDTYRGDASVRTWLIAILRLKIADRHRRNAHLPSAMGADGQRIRDRSFDHNRSWRNTVSEWVFGHDPVESVEFRKTLDNCLAQLPKTLSSVFLLREIEELPIETLARNLELSEANVRVRLHRARLLLRECLSKNWFADETIDGRETS